VKLKLSGIRTIWHSKEKVYIPVVMRRKEQGKIQNARPSF
jgi:hypothetical protein